MTRPSLYEKLKKDIVPLLKLNLIFIVACIPLISVPSAVQAMTKVTLSLIEGQEPDVIRDFLTVFRDDFFEGLWSGVILAALFIFFGYVAWFYQLIRVESNLFMILLRYATILPVLLIYCVSCYLWVINVKVEQKTGAKVKNAISLTFICIRSTLLCLLAGGIFTAVLLLGAPYSIPFAFIGAFAIWNYISSYYVLPMVETFILGISRNEDG